MLSCYQFDGSINVFGKRALQKLSFSSVFEAHASKTCKPPIETMISINVVRGLVSSEIKQRSSLSLLSPNRAGLLFQQRLEKVKDNFQILLKDKELSCFSLTNRGALLFAVEKVSSSRIAHPKME